MPEIEVLGLAIPFTERIAVEEREALELYAIEANQKNHAPSRQKYEALSILAHLRLGKELPAWLSEGFEKYRKYIDEDYISFEFAVEELLEPFSAEQALKKSKQMAKALEISGDARKVKAIIQASERVIEVFRAALKKLEKAGPGSN